MVYGTVKNVFKGNSVWATGEHLNLKIENVQSPKKELLHVGKTIFNLSIAVSEQLKMQMIL